MRKPYPLTALQKVREDAVDDATRDLATAVTGREIAQQAHHAATEKQAEAQAEAADVRAAEATAMQEGTLTAADLMRKEAWELGEAQRQALLARDVERAAKNEQQAREAEAARMAEVAQRKADADVVEKDREKFERKQTKAQEAAEEEAGEEAWRPRE